MIASLTGIDPETSASACRSRSPTRTSRPSGRCSRSSLLADWPGGGCAVDVELSDEQRFLQQTVRKFLEHAAPLSALRERAERGEPPFDRDYWRRAAGLGLAAVLVPEEFGRHRIRAARARPGHRGGGDGPADRARPAAGRDLGRGRRAGAGRGTPDQQRAVPAGRWPRSLLAAWAVAEAPDVVGAGRGRDQPQRADGRAGCSPATRPRWRRPTSRTVLPGDAPGPTTGMASSWCPVSRRPVRPAAAQ